MTAVNVSNIVTGLADFGTDIGAFITNLIPAVVTLAIVGAIVTGIVLIFKGVFSKMRIK